jgi:hypothetical protein
LTLKSIIRGWHPLPHRGGVNNLQNCVIFRFMTVTTEIKCPHCGQTSDIVIEVESPSDYYPSSECEHCDGNLSKHPNYDFVVYEAVTDGYAGQSDYYSDTREDR